MNRARTTSTRLRWICAFGLAISLYSLYVKLKLGKDENYKPICDVADYVSCSLVFKSNYGDNFGFNTKLFYEQIPKNLNQPNGAIGCVFYLLYFLSSFFEHRWLCVAQLIICSFTLILCFYLGFLLVFVFYNCCVVCVTIYIIQTWLFLEVFRRYKRLYMNK
ncbi:uncharacterized protein Dana_GF11407 [Drosophila ananassae]|uniref:vitamin-K-epoxide reductase (warfarin-sensitive) n=1 Tax=Drosophila ananassae TaxID=7217 RepID=B3MDB1_DROAN|nr:vitamin K epoxide reductase complex subunit 1 [Drosophila ananassae]EDV37444.1 uncharacterized protein Dana_GF11407 [Drosophila ananassae]